MQVRRLLCRTKFCMALSSPSLHFTSLLSEPPKVVFCGAWIIYGHFPCARRGFMAKTWPKFMDVVQPAEQGEAIKINFHEINK